MASRGRVRSSLERWWRTILGASALLVTLSAGSCVAAQIGSNQVRVVPREVEVGYRTGAVCRDGWSSGATGRGACSWHGGVAAWRYTRTEFQYHRITWLSRNEDALRRAGERLLVLALTMGLVGIWAVPEPPARPVPPRPAVRAVSGSHSQAPPRKPRRSHREEPERHFGRCPRCEGWLVRRYRRRHRKPFKGCTGYPVCRYSEALEPGARSQKRSSSGS